MAQGRSSALGDLLEQYSTGVPGSLQGVNAFLSSSRETGIPGFDDIFKNFEKASEARINKQAAEIREGFGSRGARFGSDVLRAETTLRTEGARDIIAGAAPLRQAQLQEILGTGGLAISAAGAETDIREAAMSRLFLDFMRRTAPPPLLEGLANFALGLGGPSGQPTTVVG